VIAKLSPEKPTFDQCPNVERIPHQHIIDEGFSFSIAIDCAQRTDPFQAKRNMLGINCGCSLEGQSSTGMIAPPASNVSTLDERPEQLRMAPDQIVNQRFCIIQPTEKTELSRQLETNADTLRRNSSRGPECFGCAEMVAGLMQQVTTFDQCLDVLGLLVENIVEHHRSLIVLTKGTLVASHFQPKVDISGDRARGLIKILGCAERIAAAAFASADFNELFWRLIGSKHGQAVKAQLWVDFRNKVRCSGHTVGVI
jgi:hypothetical protein